MCKKQSFGYWTNTNSINIYEQSLLSEIVFAVLYAMGGGGTIIGHAVHGTAER